MVEQEATIIFREKAETNLCLFYAIYNAIPTAELKHAFSYGNQQPPSKEFVTVVQQHRTKEEIAETGYTEVDLLKYLQHLQRSHFISSFVWKRIKPRKATFHVIWNNRTTSNTHYILFGLATTGPTREKLIKRLKAVHQVEKKQATKEEQVRVYHSFTAYSKRDCTDHAIAISNVDEELWISDNARRKKRQIVDMTTVAQSLISFQCMYVFKIE